MDNFFKKPKEGSTAKKLYQCEMCDKFSEEWKHCDDCIKIVSREEFDPLKPKKFID